VAGSRPVENEPEARKALLEGVRGVPVLAGAVIVPSRSGARLRVLADAEDEIESQRKTMISKLRNQMSKKCELKNIFIAEFEIV